MKKHEMTIREPWRFELPEGAKAKEIEDAIIETMGDGLDNVAYVRIGDRVLVVVADIYVTSHIENDYYFGTGAGVCDDAEVRILRFEWQDAFTEEILDDVPAPDLDECRIEGLIEKELRRH